MVVPFARRTIFTFIALAYGFNSNIFAQGAYPALPPTLSTSVAPNVVLYLDTSGSMLQDVNNNWMLTNLCNSNNNWSACVNNNTNGYRDSIDSATTSPNTKMNIAKRVAKNIVNNNRKLRFGLFSFEDKKTSIGGSERGQGSVLRYAVNDMSNDSNRDDLFVAIDKLNGRTSTPLGEGLIEITEYLRGGDTRYSKLPSSYTSPIQYRCQKNFAIVVTDGDATDETQFDSISYKAIDGAGNHVDKTFNVCTTSNSIASNDQDVNCPAVLEGGATDRSFGDSNNRPAALRDVAKFANVADLRVGGNDLDGKSFDDPKFKKQNLITYTIGFSVNNAVLPAAASVGQGKYYTANSESQLSTALQTAVNGITDSISNAGGVAVQSEVSAAGNKLFQPVFNPSGWYGELRCYLFDAASPKGIGASCSPNPKAVMPSTGRVIHTSKVVVTPTVGDNETTAFSFVKGNLSTMTSSQQSSLGSTAANRENVVDFIRGVEGIAGFRSRYSSYVGSTVLLGDIVDGQPVVVSSPKGNTPDSQYAAFKSENASRNIVFVGANDGMLHAFRVDESVPGAGDNMKEIMGYIPSAVYPNLKSLSASDYGSTTPHTYHVNGVLKYEDVKISTGWTTLVVGGLGQGGQGYFAVDAKNQSNLASPGTAIRWEWTDRQDSELGYSFGSPLIYNVRTSASEVVPAVILSNGYESDFDDTGTGGFKTASDSSALYILNAETGALIKKISVPGGAGLSSPAGLDVGQDGILDYVYAGDISGKLWRFDLTASSPGSFKLVTPAIFDAGSASPIVFRPVVKPIESEGGVSKGNIILFGTGKLLTDADRADTTVQSLYGILDKMDAVPTTVPNTFSSTSLVQQSFIDTYTNSAVDSIDDGVYRKVSSNSINLMSGTNTNLGWAIRLPDTGERLVATPLIYDEKVVFATGTPFTTEKCLPGGAGWVLGLNPFTGSVVRKNNSVSGAEYSYLDMNRDGKSTTADKVSFSSGAAFVSGFKKDGIPTELTYVATGSALAGPSNPSSDAYGMAGGVIALREANSMGVFTGNGRGTESVGLPIKRQASDGKGKLCGGTIGTADLECRTINGAPTGAARVEATIWREIK